MALAGITRNISSNGVLFTSDREPDLGGPIEYIITLNHDGSHPVNIRCMGKVVRAEKVEEDPVKPPCAFQIAATLERYEFVRA